ncbi:hypothetical protein DIPPA_06942 [Diplonema papillatum]|nr:hypothetical protein DIPPA_06942 [Diplonema papillatum]
MSDSAAEGDDALLADEAGADRGNAAETADAEAAEPAEVLEVTEKQAREIAWCQHIARSIVRGDLKDVKKLLLTHEAEQAPPSEPAEGGDSCPPKQGLSQFDDEVVQYRTSLTVSHEGVKAPLLLHAVAHNRRKIASFLHDITSSPQVRRDAVFSCLRYGHYDVALVLLAKKTVDVNHQRESDGNSVAHVVCAKPKPPVAFLGELCRLKAFRVNSANYAGHTPIHLLALQSVGIEGREACQLLKAKGALLEKQTPEGRTALQITQNAYLREVLALSSCHRKRQNPVELLSRDTIDSLDKTPWEKLPAVTVPSVAGLAKAAIAESYARGQQGAAPRFKAKKIAPSAETDLINRLYTVALQKQEETMRDLSKRALSGSKTKTVKLTSDEQEESTDRLYSAARVHEEKLESLVEKYVIPYDTKFIPPDDLKESVVRLYNTSVEKTKERHELLSHKYLPKSLVFAKFGGKRLSPLQSKEVGSRLHDGAVAKQKETLDRLKNQYLASPKPTRVMTPEQWQAMGARLTVKN